jgi:hypothetical protein
VGKSRILVAVAAATVALAALAGCVQSTTAAKPSVSSSSAASATPTPTVTATPAYLPSGTAQANKAYFDLVNTKFFAANGSALGRPIIDNLVAAGFPKAEMQVTPDKTAIGHNVDSILFAVKIGGSCLLGQHGGGGYSSSVVAALTTGGPCLVGLTRTIDW